MNPFAYVLMLVATLVGGSSIKCSDWSCVPWRGEYLGVAGADFFAYIFAGLLISQRLVDGVICEGDHVEGLFLTSCPGYRSYGAIIFYAVTLTIWRKLRQYWCAANNTAEA